MRLVGRRRQAGGVLRGGHAVLRGGALVLRARAGARAGDVRAGRERVRGRREEGFSREKRGKRQWKEATAEAPNVSETRRETREAPTGRAVRRVRERHRRTRRCPAAGSSDARSRRRRRRGKRRRNDPRFPARRESFAKEMCKSYMTVALLITSCLPPPAAGRTRTGSGSTPAAAFTRSSPERDPPRTANFFQRRLTPSWRPPRPPRVRGFAQLLRGGFFPFAAFAALASAAAAAASAALRGGARRLERRQRGRSDARQADHGEGGAGPGPSRRAPPPRLRPRLQTRGRVTPFGCAPAGHRQHPSGRWAAPAASLAAASASAAAEARAAAAARARRL